MTFSVRTANGIPDEREEEECPAGFDGDGDVDTADLLFLPGAWGAANGDVDDDGDTDAVDLLVLLGAWGECPYASIQDSSRP
jgi:hypothetical protein